MKSYSISLPCTALAIALGATLPIHADLVANWKFEGDATDSSGNGYDLGPLAANTPTSGTAGGISGTHSRGFGGAAWITNGLTDTTIFNPPSFTVSLWIAPDDVNPAFNEILGFVQGGAGASTGWGIRASNSGGNPGGGNDQIIFLTYGTSSQGLATVIGPEGTFDGGFNTWYHIAATYDGTTGAKNLYVHESTETWSGADTSAATTTGSINTPIDGDISLLGQKPNVPEFRSGIDEVSFYNEVLTEAQIQSLFENPGSVIDTNPTPPAPIAHYWDFDTDNGGDFIPDDLFGGLVTGETIDPVDLATDSLYGEAFTGSGASLNTLAGESKYLIAETHNGTKATALDFGTGSFAFSYWSFDNSSGTVGDGDPLGAQVFDCLDGSTTGLQLGTDASGYYNLRLDDDAGNELVTNLVTGFENVRQTPDQWVHVAVNVDRTANLLTIYFDGVAIPEGSIDISSLTGSIFCTQDLQIGVRNGGGANGSQTNGLDDLAFYPGALSQQQITDLAGATTTPLDILPTFIPPGPIPIISVSYDSGEITVEFTSENGKTYSVFGGQDLTDPAVWPEVSTTDLVGDGTDLPFSHTPGVSPFFLQVRED